MNYVFACPKCGAEVQYEERNAHRFDTSFGWPIVEDRPYCPNKRRWLDGHYRGGWEARTIDPDSIPRGLTLDQAIAAATHADEGRETE